MQQDISRRKILKQVATLSAGGAVVAHSSGLISLSAAAAESDTWPKSTSANGWSIPQTRSDVIISNRIEGTEGVKVDVRGGDVATVLGYVARRFHYEIMPIENLRGPLVGHTTTRKVGAAFESNHLSGTALAIYPDHFPLGMGGGLFPQQVIVIRDILAELEGVVKWGGDEKPVKESTFFVVVPPGSAKLNRVAAKLNGWQDRPSLGAGTAVNVLAPERRRAAKRLADIQRAA